MAANQNAERERLKTLLKDTVTLLCKNSLLYHDKMKIEGVIGITLDEKDIVLVHINEAFPTMKVMQPNISSTSGSRSNTPVRCDAPEPKESHQTVDTCTSARSLPITHHMKLKRKLSENRHTDTSVTNTRRSESKCAKTPALSHVPNVEDSTRATTYPNIQTSPADLLVQTGTNESIKEESSSEVIQEMQIKTEKPDDNPKIVTVEVGDLKFLSPLSYTTPDQTIEGDFFGNGSVFTELDTFNYKTDSSARFDVYPSEADRPSVKRKRLKTDGAMPSNTSDSEDEMNVAQRDNLSKSVLSWPSTSEADNEDGVRKYPSCALSSKSIKQCLKSELILPLVNKNYWALAVRITWRNNPEQAWNQIVRTRQECDMTVGALDGVCFFLSAVTGLFRHASTKGDTEEKPIYPGISYWVVFDGTKDSLDYEVLLSALNEMDLGCEVKKLITHGRDPTQADISNALFISVKDHHNTCIRKKIDHSTKVCFGTVSRKMPCVKLIINSMKTKPIVKQAHKELLKNNFESTLESWV